MSHSSTSRRSILLLPMLVLASSCGPGDVAGPRTDDTEPAFSSTTPLTAIRIDLEPRIISLSRSATITAYLYGSDDFDPVASDHGATLLEAGETALAGAVNLPVPYSMFGDIDSDGRTDVVLIYRVADLVARGMNTKTRTLRIVNRYDLRVAGRAPTTPRIVP